MRPGLLRLVLLAALLAAGGFVTFGVLLLLFVGGAGCETAESARAHDGAWRIERTDCGATVGFIWRVHVRGADGTERLALETTPYPDAARAEIDGAVLRVWPAGPGPAWDVPLDAHRRPHRALRLYEGQLRR